MNIHEYQAKELLRKFNVPVPFGKVVHSAEEAGGVTYEEFVKRGVETVVLKAQIHAGGRGKGTIYNVDTGEAEEVLGKPVRGVTVIHGGNIADKAYQMAKAVQGNNLVTIQTGAAGKIVNKMLVEEGLDIKQEFYAGIVLDRQTSMNMVMVSTEGGVEIEEVAETHPEKIIKEPINPIGGFRPHQARRLAFATWVERCGL